MEDLLIGNGLLLTLANDNRMIEDGAVLVRGDLIEEFGDTTMLRAANPDAKFLDAGGGIIMPGLICAHHHLYSAFACGVQTEPPANFVENLKNLWWRLDRALESEDVFASAMVTLPACIRSGTTTVIDHHASPGAIERSLDRLADAAQRTGVRVCLCYEVTDRNGPEGAKAGILENVRFLRRCRKERNPMLAGLFGLHAGMTVGEETLKASVDAAREFETGFHFHLAEDIADQEDSLAKHGTRLVERFHREGVLGERSVAIHGVHLEDEEISILAETGTAVVHNPQSNMKNAVGRTPMLRMLEKGVLVGLGTDGMTSNMWNEARTSMLVHRHDLGDPRVAFDEPLDLLLKNNPTIAGRIFERPLGVIETGAYADIIIVDYVPCTPISPESLYGHLAFGVAASPVDTTVVNGRVLMRNKELTHLDEPRIRREASQRSAGVWSRM